MKNMIKKTDFMKWIKPGKKRMRFLWTRFLSFLRSASFWSFGFWTVCLLLFALWVRHFSVSVSQDQVENLQKAILRSAVHCYATEGAYPESLDYLKENYGICWNEDKYVVDYDIFASNLLPTVTVIPYTS